MEVAAGIPGAASPTLGIYIRTELEGLPAARLDLRLYIVMTSSEWEISIEEYIPISNYS